MTTESKFPTELLSQPIRDQVASFCDQTVDHPVLANTLQETKQFIRYTQPGRLILLYGPPSVGKTTLRQRLVKNLIAESRNRISSTPDDGMPVAFMEAIPPQVNIFDGSDFYTRAIRDLNNQFAEYKDLDLDPLKEKLSKPKLRVSSNKLRMTFEDLLRERHPQVFILDGLSRLLNITHPHVQYEFLDTIKFLAERTGVVWLLIGSHDLLEWANGHARVARLSHGIPFPRYRLESPHDEAVFRDILFDFEQLLPLPEPPDLVKVGEYIYEKSLGCVGVVKEWLTDALTDALIQGKRTLNLAHLKRNEPSPDYLLKLFYEIQRGEEFVKETEAKKEHLKFLLRRDEDRRLPKPQKRIDKKRVSNKSKF